MKWSNFENKFHPSWHSKIKPFIESLECDIIYSFLKEETKRGKQLTPISSNTFRCFLETDLNDLKCVIIGDGPYMYIEEGIPVATGILMDCSITEKASPMLEAFYEGLEKEIYDGLELNYIKDWSLEYLSKQGVLLLNSSLTTEQGIVNAHAEIWKPFMEFILGKIIGRTGVPIIYMGEQAQKYMYLTEQSNLSYEIKLPFSSGAWDTKGVFSNVSKEIDKINGESIMWLNINVPF